MFAKKSSITLSMSWIFMIIVGVFFLLVAYNIIDKYRSIEEDKYNLNLKWQLREIFNNVGRTSGIEETKLNPLSVLFQNKKIEILCYEGVPILSIDGNLDSNNDFLQNYPTFMTLIDQGKKDNSYLAVESFRIPFKTTNTMAIISKKNLIVFDSNSKSSRQLVDKFRKSSYSKLNFFVEDLETFNQDVFLNTIVDKGYNSVFFVSDVGINFNDSILDSVGSLAFHVAFNETGSKTGQIIYTLSNLTQKKFNYIDWDESQTLQTMAIFSTPDVFSCSYNLVLKNTKETFKFYIKKAQILSNISKTKWVCSAGLGSKSAQSVNYDDLQEKINKTLDFIKNENFNKPNDLLNLLNNIDASQKNIEKFTCQLVY